MDYCELKCNKLNMLELGEIIQRADESGLCYPSLLFCSCRLFHLSHTHCFSQEDCSIIFGEKPK